jgi:prepilin-type N-terminal cleavage/methylation domain-containing protein
MIRRTSRRASKGFTLLEVLLATAIMAVGTTSVLVVIATAAGMASQRQVGLRRAQVVDEAIHDAQAMVDSFRPAAAKAAPVAKKGEKGDPKAGPSAQRLGPEDVKGKASKRYAGFNYDLTFAPKDRMVLDRGYDVGITVHYGGGELSYSTGASMISTTIAPDEFERSTSYIEEQSAQASAKPKETKR